MSTKSVVTVILCVIAAFVFPACSGKGSVSVVPDQPQGMAQSPVSNPGGPVLWGLYEISIDPSSGKVDIAPVRGVQFTANVTMFMQPPTSKTQLLSLSIDMVKSKLSEGYVECDVTLKHPFPSMGQYRGFDVHGICMGDGSTSLGLDSTARYSNSSELMLLNSDGYTRWWNPTEFKPAGTIFGYQQGAMAPKGYQPTATLNGYKYFADELTAQAPLALDPAKRGTFSPSAVNTRRYVLQFPVVSGVPVYKFEYAIEANWEQPDPSGAPTYPVSSFSIKANAPEAYQVSVADIGSTAWFIDDTHKGGFLKLGIRVNDWQAPINPSGVRGELAALWVEGEALNAPVDVLPTATATGGDTTSSVFEAEIDSLNLKHGGLNELWIIAQSVDPNSYKPQIDGDVSAWTWPPAPLAAYLRTSIEIGGVEPQSAPTVSSIVPDNGMQDMIVPATVNGSNFANGAQVELRKSSGAPFTVFADSELWVSTGQITCSLNLTGTPIGAYDVVVVNPDLQEGSLPAGFTVNAPNVIFVDDSNTSGVEDGTQAHPYNTIQEGLTAATSGFQVWVDDSGTSYPETIALKAGVPLKSVNWDTSDGGDMASISSGLSPIVTGADGASIDGFQIRDGQGTGVDINGVSTTVQNCLIGPMSESSFYAHIYGILVSNSTGSIIKDSEISGLHVSGSYCPYFGLYLVASPIEIDNVKIHDMGKSGNYNTEAGLYATGCQPVGANHLTITHCTIYDIYPEGSLGGSYTNTSGININASDNAEISNNIVYSVTGGNYDNAFGIQVSATNDAKLVNNVIYNVGKAYYYGTAYGLYFTACLNLDVRNIIISHINTGSQGYFVTAYGAVADNSTSTFQYNDVYDCSSGLYVGLAPGTGCISLNPMYTNPGTDFHLATGSPCIDAGDPTILDPDGSTSDMGAYGGQGGDW